MYVSHVDGLPEGIGHLSTEAAAATAHNVILSLSLGSDANSNHSRNLVFHSNLKSKLYLTSLYGIGLWLKLAEIRKSLNVSILFSYVVL